MSDTDEGVGRPLLRVVRGEPDDAELVALTTVVLGIASASAGASADEAGPARPQRSAWSDPANSVRRTLPHGPGSWRASAFPR
ncbi:MAG TPA: acyl-CoA carboxylase subunit epsilon [Pseudonocardiaceae bacterium]|nr:acyl-CoA carboxylase subunit epsilon [Pseudonocardiaceae bacterium]